MRKAWYKTSKQAINGSTLQVLLAKESTNPEDQRLNAIIAMSKLAGCKRSVATKLVSFPWLTPCGKWLDTQNLVLCSLTLDETAMGNRATMKIAAREHLPSAAWPKAVIELSEQGHFFKYIPHNAGNPDILNRYESLASILRSHAAFLAGEKKAPVHKNAGRPIDRSKAMPQRPKVVGFVNLSEHATAASHPQEHTPA